jgi:tripartite-type tricarboxylate transporter receptor subunit TctC
VRIHELHEVRERYASLGLEAVSSTPQKFSQIIEADAGKLSKIIKATGAKVD